jgi:hypothetical protein
METLEQSRANAAELKLPWAEPAVDALPVCSLTAEGVLIYNCPGCDAEHGLTLKTPAKPIGRLWRWGGSVVTPTVNPTAMYPAVADRPCCHHFMIEGVLEFLPMTTHALRGKKVAMLPL